MVGPYDQLSHNLRTAEEVYEAALDGALYHETHLHRILGDTGLKSHNQIFEKEKYKDKLKYINAATEGEKRIKDIKIPQGSIKVIRSVMKEKLERIRNVPLLAREQMLITFATLVEGYNLQLYKSISTKFKI